MAYYNETSSSTTLVNREPHERNDGTLYGSKNFDVFSGPVPRVRTNPARGVDSAKTPRRAIDLFSGLKLKERVTTRRRRRSSAIIVPIKERKSDCDSREKAKKIKNLREVKISRPLPSSGGWDVEDLIGSDHPGLAYSPGPQSPTPPSDALWRPTSPLLPEPPSPRSMLTGPPSQRSLPSIPASPNSPLSVDRSFTFVDSGPPSPDLFFAGTPPPRTPLPKLPSAASLYPKISPLSPPNPLNHPSRSLREEQWPLRNDSRLEITPKALTVESCPEPSRQPPTAPGSSSLSSNNAEPRKESPMTLLSLWPPQEISRKPLCTAAFSLSPKQARAEPRGGKPLYSSPTNPEPRIEPSQWLTRPAPQQGPLGGEPLPSSPRCPEADSEPLSSFTRLSHRRGPRYEEPRTANTPCPEPKIEASPSLSRLMNHLGEPRGVDYPNLGAKGPDPRSEPSPWLTSPSPCRGPRDGESLASSPSCTRRGIAPAPLLTRLTTRPKEPRGGDSPTLGVTRLEPRTEPPPSLPYPSPRRIRGSGPASGSKYKRGILAQSENIEPRDESNLSSLPITYHLALAGTNAKYMTQMAKGEQELDKLREKTKLYEDFFLAIEAGGPSLLRGRPRSLGELKQRLESQLRVMEAKETRMAKGSGWF